MTSLNRKKAEDAQLVLGILEAIDGSKAVTQRAVASELGVALGLVNAYLKRCMKKGLVKMQSAPARRYAYYLTPEGFSEKSRLTASYLAHSFSFFRKARADCQALIADATKRGMVRVALVGASDLAEIMRLCTTDTSVALCAIVDGSVDAERYSGLKVVPDFSGFGSDVDGCIITSLVDPRGAYERAVEAFGAERVLIPALLSNRVSRPIAAVASRRRAGR